MMTFLSSYLLIASLVATPVPLQGGLVYDVKPKKVQVQRCYTVCNSNGICTTNCY